MSHVGDSNKVEKRPNEDATFNFENVRFLDDNRVYFTGTASNQNYDGGK